MQFFRTCDKWKGNTFGNDRLTVCSGRRTWLEHWATAVTIRVRSPIVPKKFLYLKFILVQFSLHQQRLSPSFLSFGRLYVMLNCQGDVLLLAAKFAQQNGAYVYFVDRIKRNLRRSQLACTNSEVWIFLKIPETAVDITTINHLRFNLMSVCSLCWRSRDVKCQ